MIKKILLISLLVLAAVGIFLVGFEQVYAEQLLPGITIDGQSFAGKNRTAVAAALGQKYRAYSTQGLTLVRGDNQQHLSLADAGLSFDTDEAVARAFAIAHPGLPGYGTVQT